MPILLLWPAFRGASLPPRFRRAHFAGAGLVALGLIATVFVAFQPRMLVAAVNVPTPVAGRPIDGAPAGEWPAWGRTNAGTRYSPLDQITPANVADLKVAWTYRTGDVPKGGQGHIVTPLPVGGKLFGWRRSSNS